MLTRLVNSVEASLKRLDDALTEIEQHIGANIERSQEIQRRVLTLRARVREGAGVADVLREEESPRSVEMITINMKTLEMVGSELRASLAITLRDEGLTLAEIADLFGVTRQRISALLRQKAALEVGHTL